MRLPTAVVGVTTMAALVAVSSVLAFVITKNNAEDSIDIVSKRLAISMMQTVTSEIKFKLQKESEDAVMSAKSDIEHGIISLNSSPEVWVRRASHFFMSSGFFKLYFFLPGSRALGDVYGLGMLIDVLSSSLYFNNEPFLDFQKPYFPENGTWINTFNGSAPRNVSQRPFVTMFTQGPNIVQYRSENRPRWIPISVALNPGIAGGGGPFTALTAPVFRTLTPNPADFIGVTGVGLYLSFFSLNSYLLSIDSSLLLVNGNRDLIISTDVDKVYYQNGTLPNGKPNFVFYTLRTMNLTLYHTVDAALPDLSLFTGDEEYFSTFSHGDKYWLQVFPVYHSNLRWYLIGLIPEKVFFQKIYDSNRDTTIIVTILIISSVIIATVVTFAFTTNLTRLAKAFDKVADMHLDHPDVLSVGRSHVLFELNSLYRGFWHAVEMVKQVQAFLPKAVIEASEDESVEQTATDVSDGTKTGVRTAASSGKGPGLNMFSLGLRLSRPATSMTVQLATFTEACRQGLDSAVERHVQLFGRIVDLSKANKGVISHLEGNRIVITWNTVRECASSTSKQCSTNLALEIVSSARDIMPVDIGINTGLSFHGILGSAQQRFNVIGSDLVDVGSHMALHARELGLVPSVFASDAVVDGLNGMTVHLVDKVRSYTGVMIGMHWVRGRMQVTEEEWMYQLEGQKAGKDEFLDNYWAAMKIGDFTEALAKLAHLGDSHSSHVQELLEKLFKDTQIAQRLEGVVSMAS
eukprot:TRINITY_DN2796_c0_g2_i1.p1 TRINITY_DN2796_c0_g2~~TRINITY_DN2796_c0_g2_i1.p1  ORF type:complete len:745 (+),score=231.01 TRINITY_DN2796_c0_g2_i1:70-2304(+)